MQDVLAHTLKMGDTVAYSRFNASEITLGKVISFTPQQVRIERYPNDVHGLLKPFNEILKVNL